MHSNLFNFDIYLNKDLNSTPVTNTLVNNRARVYGKGYALDYVNWFGVCTEKCLMELAEIPELYVNVHPPEIQEEMDKENELYGT